MTNGGGREEKRRGVKEQWEDQGMRPLSTAEGTEQVVGGQRGMAR